MPPASWYFPNVVCSKINGSSSLDSDPETGKLECLFFITGVPPSFTFSVWYQVVTQCTSSIFTVKHAVKSRVGFLYLLIFLHTLYRVVLSLLIVSYSISFYSSNITACTSVKGRPEYFQLSLSFFTPQWLLIFCTQLQAITVLYI